MAEDERMNHVLEIKESQLVTRPLELEVKLLKGQRKEEDIVNENDDVVENLISSFLDGRYEDCIRSDLLAPLWKSEISVNSDDSLEINLCNSVDNFIKIGENKAFRELAILVCGVSALQLFIRGNWTGPSSEDNLKSFLNEITRKYNLTLQELYIHAVKYLSIDGDAVLYSKVKSPEYLWLARVLLCLNLQSISICQTFFWWALRCVQIHHMMLDQKSPILHYEALFYFDNGKLDEDILANDKYKYLQIQFHLECSAMFLSYFDTKHSEEHLECCKKIAGIDVSLTGVLGKRTYFQEHPKAQLKLNIKKNLTEENCESNPMELPKDVLMNDEVRREKISFTNDIDGLMDNLTHEEQALILGLYSQIQKTNPVHKLVDEELMAYLNAVISQPKIWSVQTKALMLRSQLEAKHNKTSERAMLQFQELINGFNKSQPSLHNRLYLFHAVNLPPIWKLEMKLANILLKLGAVNSALEIYLRLEIWEKVVTCYQLLERKSQAEEIIRQQLQLEETPNLLCTLGDVTNDIQCYEKAWTLSNGRSARAQRCLGLYYFAQKEYSSCIQYLKKSLELNHLQLGVSSNLGYAAMQTENWETAASAYRHCLNLEPDNFQAWNNLANVYLKLNQKPRAWKALQEALRCDFDNWRIWENYMVVSVDCGAFEEGIVAYHRLLELKEKYVDIEILTLLTKAVTQDMPSNDESSSVRLKPKLLQLFGRLTAQVMNNSRIWDLYANLVSANCVKDETILEKIIQLRQRAQRIASQQSLWEKSKETCEEVVDLSLRLANDQIHYSQLTSEKKPQSLVSAKLMLQGISSKLKQTRQTNLTPESAPYLPPLIERVDVVINTL